MSVSLYGNGQTVIQVVQTVVTTAYTYTGSSATWFSVTGWTATITPQSTTSKILIMYQGNLSNATAGNYASLTKLQKNGSDLTTAMGATRGSATNCSTANYQITASYPAFHQFTFLDSPSTTSATTYSIQAYGESGGGNLTVGGSSTTSNAYNSSTPFVITLMEISGS